MCLFIVWQVSGAHGFDPNKDKAVAAMSSYAGTVIINILFKQ